MILSYKYRIYPTETQEKEILNIAKNYNIVWNVAVNIVKTKMIKDWIVNNKPIKKTSSGKEYPDYKLLRKFDIVKLIYHLKDDDNCIGWSYFSRENIRRHNKPISEKDFEIYKEQIKKKFKVIPSTSFNYIAASIAEALNQNYNSKIIEYRIKQFKKKMKKREENIKKGLQPKKIHTPTWFVDDIEYKDNFHLNFHKFSYSSFSYTFQCQNQTALKKNKDGSTKFFLPKVGLIKVIFQRDFPENSKFDAVNISRAGKFWYASFNGLNIQDKPLLLPSNVNDIVGIDKNSKNHMYTSDGEEIINNMDKIKKIKKRINKLQKRNGENSPDCKTKTKRVFGSKRWQKVNIKIASLYEKINHIKNNMIHNMTSSITDRYDLICLEDLCNIGMSKYNGRYTNNNNYTDFDNFLKYKAQLKGKHIVKVSRWYPSTQTCSHCGKIHPEMKNMNIRILRCDCDTIIDRDYNAAINLKKEGYRIFSEENHLNNENIFENSSKKCLTSKKLSVIE